MKKNKLTLKTEILREIFNIAPRRFKEENLDNHILAKKFQISGKELKANIDFLVETGLIHRFPGKDYKEDRLFDWVITERGLDYLERKEGEERQEKNNRVIAFTGGIIALTTIYAFISQSISLKDYLLTYWFITIVFLILILMCLWPLTRFVVKYWLQEAFGR